MKVYREVPMWWYIAMFVGSFAMAMATIYTADSGLPWWGLIVGLIISAVFLPFVITVYAITGFSPNIQNLVQVGFMSWHQSDSSCDFDIDDWICDDSWKPSSEHVLHSLRLQHP
jgi:uncharacterized membrane protein